MNQLRVRIKAHYQRFGGMGSFSILDSNRGGSDSIVAFSLFGNSRRYIDGALLNIEKYAEIFPEFACRFYVPSNFNVQSLGVLRSEGAEVYIMNGLDSNHLFRFWRFLASEDLTLKTFLIRDVDSTASWRERDLYEKFKDSGKDYHIIRDHFSHNERIMAGMWGGHPKEKLLSSRLRKLKKYPNIANRDQMFLAQEVYPDILPYALVNDIIPRFPEEDPVITRIDNVNFSFIGEIATDLEMRDDWRKEFQRLVYERKHELMK